MVACQTLAGCTLNNRPTGTSPRETVYVQNTDRQAEIGLDYEIRDSAEELRIRRDLQDHEKRQADHQTLVLCLEDREDQFESQEAEAAVEEASR